MAKETHYDKPARTSVEKTKRLKRGYPLGPGGKRVTKKPPQTTRNVKRGTLGEDEAEAARKYDAETIQEKQRIERELGITRGN